MANVERKTVERQVERVVVETVEETVYQLELTEYEMKVLGLILMRIGGSPVGPRGQAQNVLDEIRKVIDFKGTHRINTFFDGKSNTIYFNELDEKEFDAMWKTKENWPY